MPSVELRPRIQLLGLFGILSLALGAWSCGGIQPVIESSSKGTVDERREGMDDLSEAVRGLVGDAGDPGDRETVDQFLRAQFEREPDPINRSKLLGIALQGEFPCAVALVSQGVRDRDLMVRQAAILGMDEARPDNARQLLTDLLRSDDDLIIRIEVVKAFRRFGARDWVDPLVAVILDQTEDPSLRYQAHLSAKKLTGEDIPSIPDWEGWRARNKDG